MTKLSIEDQVLAVWADLKRSDPEATLMDATIHWLKEKELEAEEIVPHLSESFKDALGRAAKALCLLKERNVPTGNVPIDI